MPPVVYIAADMTTRRNFLAVSLTALASSAISQTKKPVPQKIGLQLYTVRKQAEADLPKTLAEVRAAGYGEVEMYWNVYSHPAAQLKRMVHDAGLEAPSGHFDYPVLEGKLDYARELGVQYVVCPMLPKPMWKSAKEFHDAADQFNRWGAKIQNMGMTFAFHNHNYEFQQFGAETGFDILMRNTDPTLVKLELDCYWITQAGLDPVTMLEKYKDRIRMLHLKDRKPGFPTTQTLNKDAEHFTEFGTGSIKWPPIIAKAKEIGVDHYFVEQDELKRPAWESIRLSFKNARQVL